MDNQRQTTRFSDLARVLGEQMDELRSEFAEIEASRMDPARKDALLTALWNKHGFLQRMQHICDDRIREHGDDEFGGEGAHYSRLVAFMGFVQEFERIERMRRLEDRERAVVELKPAFITQLSRLRLPFEDQAEDTALALDGLSVLCTDEYEISSSDESTSSEDSSSEEDSSSGSEDSSSEEDSLPEDDDFGGWVAWFMRRINDGNVNFEYPYNSDAGRYQLPSCHWDRSSGWNGTAPAFQTLEGVSPSDAIRCVFEHQLDEDRVIECRTAILLSNLAALTEVLDDDEEFDRLFKGKLQLGGANNSLEGCWKDAFCDEAEDLPIGAWCVFRNHPHFEPRMNVLGVKQNAFRNENAIVVKAGQNPRFEGFGVTMCSEEALCNHLRKEYNRGANQTDEKGLLANEKYPPLQLWTDVPGIRSERGIPYKLFDFDALKKK